MDDGGGDEAAAVNGTGSSERLDLDVDQYLQPDRRAAARRAIHVAAEEGVPAPPLSGEQVLMSVEDTKR